MKKLLLHAADLFFLTRPTLIFVVWIFILVGARALAGLDAESVSAASGEGGTGLWILLMQYFCIFGSAFVINQLHDLEGDRANRKLGTLERELVSEREALWLAWLLFGAGILLALQLGLVNLLLTLGFFLLTGVIYNKPPLTAKDRPLLGPLTLVLAYAVLVLQGAALAGWKPLGLALWTGLPICLAGLSISLLTTLPDQEGDRLAGKVTFALRYGVDRTWIGALLLMASAFLLAWLESDPQVMYPALVAGGLMVWGLLTKPAERAGGVARWAIFLQALALVPNYPLYGLLMLVYYFGARMYYRHRFELDYPSLKI